jgi:hypothetical protein
MASWWLGLWSILSAVFTMLLDVTQFWKDVSVPPEAQPEGAGACTWGTT